MLNSLESLSDISPTVVVGNQKTQLQQLSFFPLFQGDLGVFDQQWNQLSSVEQPLTNDVEQFWVGVANHKYASGENNLKELSDLVLSMLALPFSKSAVEMVFSQMNLIKTKFRNRMQQDILEALLQICGYLAQNNICCNTFTPTSEMLTRFVTHIHENVEVEDKVPEEF